MSFTRKFLRFTRLGLVLPPLTVNRNVVTPQNNRNEWMEFSLGKWEVLNLYHCLIRCFQIAENVEEKRTVIHYVSRHSIGQLEDLSFASRSMSLVHETNSKMIIGPSSVAFCHPTNLCYSPPRFLDCQSTLPKKCRQICPPPPRNGYLRATPPCHHCEQEV